MARKTTRMFARKFRFISIVDAGACEGAEILIAKAKNETAKVGAKMSKPRMAKLMAAMNQLQDIMTEVMGEQMPENAEKHAALTAAHAELNALVEKMGSEMNPEHMKKMMAVMQQLQSLMQDMMGGEDDMAEKKTDEAAALKAENEALKAEIETLKAQIPAKEPTEEEVLKALPESLRTRFVETEKRAREAEETAKAERDARETAEFVEKAKVYKALPVKPDSFGLILKRASKALSKEDVAEIERVLKAADEALITAKVFGEIGRGGSDAGSAKAEVNALATEKRSADPKLSAAEARTLVRREHPELAQRERAEQQATRH